jgi:hypothetical protein
VRKKKRMANGDYRVQALPISVFTDGLDFETEQALTAMLEALRRGEATMRDLVEGDTDTRVEHDALHRLIHGITAGAAFPILQSIVEGQEDTIDAVRGVIGGIAGFMFLGGMEYAKILGR